MFRFLSLPLVFLCGMAGCSPIAPGPSPGTAETQARTVDASRIGHFGIGQLASPEEIAGWDIDIRADGVGLPEGSGSVEDGEWLYEEQCAECHGSFGEGVGRFPVLAGGVDTLRDARPTKTVGSYWPFTSTLFDYIRRSMPFTQPASLSDDDTYALTAYVLYLNDLVADDFVLTRENLPAQRLPNELNFQPDPRPDVANVRCMSNCRDPALIQVLSEVGFEPDAIEEAADHESASESQHPGKSTYDQFCHICHDSGIGGAPQLGVADQWQKRIEGGFENLLNNAINGSSSDTGTMLPKGGFAQLTDSDVGAAVEYMIEVSQ